MELLLERTAISGTPFQFEINVNLDVLGVTGVTATSPTTAYPLVSDGEAWRGGDDFVDLATAQASLDGGWTITITGSSASTSTFGFSAAALQDSDFYATPTILNPTAGEIGVAQDVTYAWTDPTGVATPYIVAVETDDDLNDQEDDSLFGALNVTDTMWMPPLAMTNGPAEFQVFYADVDETFVTALSVVSGSIIWANSDFAPPSYPTATPLFAASSKDRVAFTVPEPSAAWLWATATAAIASLRLLQRTRT